MGATALSLSPQADFHVPPGTSPSITRSTSFVSCSSQAKGSAQNRSSPVLQALEKKEGAQLRASLEAAFAAADPDNNGTVSGGHRACSMTIGQPACNALYAVFISEQCSEHLRMQLSAAAH